MMKDSGIQHLSRPLGALPFSPCSLPACGTDTALGISLFALTPQLASSSSLVVSPAPSPTQPQSRKLLLLTTSLSFSEWQLVTRKQESSNYSIRHSQLTGMPSTRGLSRSEGEGTARGCGSRTPCFSSDYATCQAPWAHISSFLTLTPPAVKWESSSTNLLYIWGKWFHSLIRLQD